MAKSFLWTKKWFTSSPSPSSQSLSPSLGIPADSCNSSQTPSVKKNRSFFNLTSTASKRPSSLHNWSPSASSSTHGAIRLNHAVDSEMRERPTSRNIYYKRSPSSSSSSSHIGILSHATLSASDVQLENVNAPMPGTPMFVSNAAGGGVMLGQYGPRPVFADRLRPSRQRANSLSSECLPDYPHRRPAASNVSSAPHFFSASPCANSIEQSPSKPQRPLGCGGSGGTPTTHSPLSGVVIFGQKTTVSQSNINVSAKSSTVDDDRRKYDRMMQVLQNLAGSVDDLSLKVNAVLALSATTKQDNSNAATDIDTHSNQEEHTTNVDSIQPNSNVLSSSVVTRAHTPLHQSAIASNHPSDEGELSGKDDLSPTIPPLPTFLPLPRFESIPITAIETMVEESSNVHGNNPMSPRPSMAAITTLGEGYNDNGNLLSASTRNIVESLSNEIQFELQHYQQSIRSMFPASNDLDYLDIQDNDTNNNNNSNQNLSKSGVSSALSNTTLLPTPPPPLTPPPRPDGSDEDAMIRWVQAVSQIPRPEPYPPLKKPTRPPPLPPSTLPPATTTTKTTPSSSSTIPPRRPTRQPIPDDLAEVIPKLQTKIAILEQEWPELFQLKGAGGGERKRGEHNPSPELQTRLQFLSTLIHVSPSTKQ